MMCVRIRNFGRPFVPVRYLLLLVQAYTYQYTRIFRHTALLAILPFAIGLFRDFSWTGLEDAVGSALIAIVFLPLFLYYRQLMTSYVLDADRLLVRKRLGKNRSYAYADLHRVMLRQNESLGWWDEYEIRLALPEEKVVLPVTYLNDREQFLRRLQLRVEGAGKRLLFQDEAGKFHPSLQELERQEA